MPSLGRCRPAPGSIAASGPLCRSRSSSSQVAAKPARRRSVQARARFQGASGSVGTVTIAMRSSESAPRGKDPLAVNPSRAAISPTSVVSPGPDGDILEGEPPLAGRRPALGHAANTRIRSGTLGTVNRPSRPVATCGRPKAKSPPGSRIGPDGRARDRVAVGIHDPADDRRGRFERDDHGAVLVVPFLDVDHPAELPLLLDEHDRPFLSGPQGHHVELGLGLGLAIVLAALAAGRRSSPRSPAFPAGRPPGAGPSPRDPARGRDGPSPCPRPGLISFIEVGKYRPAGTGLCPGGEVPVLVHPLDRLGPGTAAIGLARIDDHAPTIATTRQPDQAIAPVRLAQVSLLMASPVRVAAACRNSGVAWANLLSRKGSNAASPCDAAPPFLYP